MPLIINGTRVNKISGPVSMYILTPKKNDIFPNLPVYMLFGDIHLSNENMCEDKSPETLDVYSLDFLSLLNTLSTPEEPIDFYVEGGDIHNREEKIKTERKYPLDKFWNLYIECYKRKKIALYPYDEKQCEKIPNVRWQSGDARSFYLNPKYKKLGCHMYSLLQTVNFDEYDYDYNSLLVSLIRLRQDENYDYDYCIKKIVSEKMFSFEDIIFSQDGLIYKQLNKIQDKSQKSELIKYIKLYCDYLTKRMKTEFRSYMKIFEETEDVLIRVIKSYYKDPQELDRKAFKYIKENWDNVQKYYVFLQSKYSLILDVYTICRSFKYLDSKDPKPIMNILYTGQYHTENIMFFLDKITGLYDVEIVSNFELGEDYYENVDEDSDEDDEDESLDNYPSRCLEIKKDIDLDNIISDVRKLRK